MTDTPDTTPEPLPEPEENEVLRETRRAKDPGARGHTKGAIGWKTAAAAAAAAGVGSAAVIAAMLYANRNKS